MDYKTSINLSQSQQNALLHASHRSVQIQVVAGNAAPLDALRDYHILLAKAEVSSTEAVRRVDFEKLSATSVLVAFAKSKGSLRAAGFAKRLKVGNKTLLEFCGFVSDGSVNGVGAPLVSALILAEEHDTFETPDGMAIARRYKDGSLNQASTGTFAKLCFRGVRDFEDTITLNDIHMLDAAEVRDDGIYVSSHLMMGSAETIGPRAWDILYAWKLTFGPSNAEREHTFFAGAKVDD